MKLLGFIVTVIAAICLLIAAKDLPNWGDVHAPVNEAVSAQHYITQTYEETTVPNLVTAVLADYRGYDTMFETVVVFIAGLSIMAIVGMQPGWQSSVPQPQASDAQKEDPIVRTTCRILMPLILLFGLYVIAHGHHSPGGGFQGGIILAAGLILLALAQELPNALRAIPPKRMLRLATIGILIYSGVGLACLLLGQQFLNYSVLAKILPLTPEAARSISMLWVEIGVAFTVSAGMFSIFAHLSSRGTLKDAL